MSDGGELKRERRRWMGVLAKSTAAELESELDALRERPPYRCLRSPEAGLALVRARIGGAGAPFNVGEMTVTRCVVELATGGAPGFAYVAGRDPRHAELAALFDALLQREPAGLAEMVERLAARQAERRAAARARVEPTRVEFFTMVRE